MCSKICKHSLSATKTIVMKYNSNGYSASMVI